MVGTRFSHWKILFYHWKHSLKGNRQEDCQLVHDEVLYISSSIQWQLYDIPSFCVNADHTIKYVHIACSLWFLIFVPITGGDMKYVWCQGVLITYFISSPSIIMHVYQHFIIPGHDRTKDHEVNLNYFWIIKQFRESLVATDCHKTGKTLYAIFYYHNIEKKNVMSSESYWQKRYMIPMGSYRLKNVMIIKIKRHFFMF